MRLEPVPLLLLVLVPTFAVPGCLCSESTAAGLWGVDPGYFDELLAHPNLSRMERVEPRPIEGAPVVHNVPFGPMLVPETNYTLKALELKTGEVHEKNEGGTTTWTAGIRYDGTSNSVRGLFSQKDSDEKVALHLRTFLDAATSADAAARASFESAFLASRRSPMDDDRPSTFNVSFEGPWRADEWFHSLERKGMKMQPPTRHDPRPVVFRHDEWTFSFSVRAVEYEDRIDLLAWASGRVYSQMGLRGHDWTPEEAAVLIENQTRTVGLPPVTFDEPTFAWADEGCYW